MKKLRVEIRIFLLPQPTSAIILASAIYLISSILGIYWCTKRIGRLTRFVTFALTLSTFLAAIPKFSLNLYASYAFAFFSILAAVEVFESIRVKPHHRTLFVYSSVVFTYFTLANGMGWPFFIPKTPFLLPILFFVPRFWIREKKRVYSRMGIMLLWFGQATANLVEEILGWLASM